MLTNFLKTCNQRSLSSFIPLQYTLSECIKQRLYCSASDDIQIFPWKETRFRGVTVDLKLLLEHDVDELVFEKRLRKSMDAWYHDKRQGVWLTVPIQHGWAMSSAAKCGFTFHHARDDTALLTAWLPKDGTSRIPPYPWHQVGVGALVFNTSNEVLVIRERNSPWYNGWKLPGGLVDFGEDLGAAAERECYEETGIHTRFESMVGLRHQHGLQYGMSDIYFVCRLTPLSSTINACEREVAACQWMNVTDVLNNVEHPLINLLLDLWRPDRDSPHYEASSTYGNLHDVHRSEFVHHKMRSVTPVSRDYMFYCTRASHISSISHEDNDLLNKRVK